MNSVDENDPLKRKILMMWERQDRKLGSDVSEEAVLKSSTQAGGADLISSREEDKTIYEVWNLVSRLLWWW